MDAFHVVCERCGSDQVFVRAWVSANTREFYDWDETYEDYWCQECEDEVDVIDSKDYNKNKDMIL